MSEDKRISQLIERFANNTCSEAEIEEIIHLIQSNKVSESHIDVERILKSLKRPEILDDDRAEKIYNKIIKSTNFNKVHKRTTKIFSKNTIEILAYAAVFVGIISLAILNNYFPFINSDPSLNSLISEENVTLELTNGEVEVINQNANLIANKEGEVIGEIKNNTLIYNAQVSKVDSLIEYNTINVPYGKKFELSLADGTRVKMNAGTSLKFPTNFSNGKSRVVYLQGEAFFNVSKDKDHPFIVKTENMDVEVLGTEFNVSAYDNDLQTAVFLVEGSVELTKEDKAVAPVLLVPGQLGSIYHDRKVISVEKGISNIYTSWMDGKLILRNVKFNELLKKLERRFNVSIENKNNQLGDEIFNANFGDESIEMVFKYLKEIQEINYEIEGDKIVIK
ncbi:FecR family protein [Lutibacter aestuarii]|uniref:FecR family protein n=1 Tax=Lutibacter aestuarii TaxID=861111 RepID=A0ABW2Z3A1_9FLAO